MVKDRVRVRFRDRFPEAKKVGQVTVKKLRLV